MHKLFWLRFHFTCVELDTILNTLNFYVNTTDGKTTIEPENLIYKRNERTFFNWKVM